MTDKPERKPAAGKRLNRLHLYHARQDAEDLQKRFENGDVLAAFECCSLWHSKGLPFSQLPSWVVDYLAGFSTAYFEVGEEKVRAGEDPRKPGNAPDLDAFAGLLGGRGGKPNAWKTRDILAKATTVDAYLESVVKALKLTGKTDYTSPMSGQTVLAFDGRGRLTKAFKTAVADDFNEGLGWGNSRDRTLDRLVEKASRRRK